MCWITNICIINRNRPSFTYMRGSKQYMHLHKPAHYFCSLFMRLKVIVCASFLQNPKPENAENLPCTAPCI